MALQDSLAELAGKSPARKNRVDLLLEKLKAEAPEDYKTLTFALRDKNLAHHVITKAIRKEYGIATVTDHSVGDWRSKNLRELTGL
jgi:hypothetical protein